MVTKDYLQKGHTNIANCQEQVPINCLDNLKTILVHCVVTEIENNIFQYSYLCIITKKSIIIIIFYSSYLLL